MRRVTPLSVLAASPTMIGAITTLIVVVAVFLAYNANQGLPFVPSYRVAVEVPNAARLVPNNEVRIGGHRIGLVESVEAARPAGGGDGQAVARLNLKLDKAAEPLPVDSIFRVRYRSTFGLKYLEVTRGRSGEPAPEGHTFEATDTTRDGPILSLRDIDRDDGEPAFIEGIEGDEIGNTFDRRTREAIRRNLVGFGNAFAARGGSLNQALEALRPLLDDLGPVAEALNDRDARLRRLFPRIGDAARVVAPLAREQAELFADMATAFAAIGADPDALRETIAEAPPTLETGIRTLPSQSRLLAELADVSGRLRPGAAALRATLPELNLAVRVGTPSLARTPPTSRRLRGVLAELERLVGMPSTGSSLERLERTFDAAAPLARWVVPAQTVCNYWNYWFTVLPEHLSERDNVGFTQRVSSISTPFGSMTLDLGTGTPVQLPGEVEAGLSNAGYAGVQANARAGQLSSSPGEFRPRELPILQGDPARPTGQDGRDCQAGQGGYILGDLRIPGQAASIPAVGVPTRPGAAPTTAYWHRDGTRVLRDTRVEGRQP